MRFRSRTLAAAGAAALAVAGSAVFVAAPAAAADYYIVDSDLTTPEVSPYPAGWFTGNPSPGTKTSTASGLDVTGQVQVLYGVEGDYANGTGLDPAAADYVSPGITLASGAASFQIPVFTDPGTNYTTLYADAAGIASNTWYTSTAFAGYAAHATDTMENFVAAMGNDYQILAFGFNVIGGGNAEIVSLDWDGDTYWFLPAAPTASVSPTSLTVSEFASTGVTSTFTGFVPGEDVRIDLSGPSSGGLIGVLTADVNGEVVAPIPSTQAVAAGATYTIIALGVTSNVTASVTFAVTADGLPATGIDAGATIALAATLLGLGAIALVVVVSRRRGMDAA